MADTDVRVCEECGASIYPEHIGAQKAGYWGGKLFCVHCFSRHQHAQVTISATDLRTPTVAVATAEAPPGQKLTRPPYGNEDLEFGGEAETAMGVGPVASEGVEEPVAPSDGEEISLTGLARPAFKPFTAGGAATPSEVGQHKHKRHLHHSGQGAIRCRIFHAKLNDGALHFMQDQINDWIDQNPEVEIKQMSTDVGIVEGKSSEPHLIITVFY